VLTGSARAAQEAAEAFEASARRHEIQRRERALEQKRKALEAQIDALRNEFEAEEEEIKFILAKEKALDTSIGDQRREMARVRSADADALKSFRRGAKRKQTVRTNGKRGTR
jgi:circadian clock protein KaiC